jgi:Tfp pilus assembly protein PilV
MAGGDLRKRIGARRLFFRRVGFTLMEVVIGTFLIAVGLVALMSAFLSGLLLVESGRNQTSANADARAIFEEMRRLSASGLAGVTTRNWSTWSASAGLTTLPSETVSVSFRNPNADPLEATVTVNWTEKTRNRSARFTGLVTRR